MNGHEFNILKRSFNRTVELNGKDEFKISAVLVPLILINGEYHIIFEERSKNISQPGEVCFPGGRFDNKKDRKLLDTALRETYEEIGIDKSKINVLGQLNTVFSPIGTIVYGFVAAFDKQSIAEIKANSSEIAEIFTVPVSFFQTNKPVKHYVQIKAHPQIIEADGSERITFPYDEFNLPEAYSRPWGNSTYGIYFYKYNDKVIWGLTARFIVDLISRLK